MPHVLAFVVALLVSSPQDATSEIRSGFKRSREPSKLIERRRDALAAARGSKGSKKLLTALFDAALTVEREMRALEEPRRALFGTPRRDRRLQSRAKLDPQRELEQELASTLDSLAASERSTALDEVCRRRGLPLALRLQLLRKLDSADARLISRFLDRGDAGELICGLTAVEALGRKGASLASRVIEVLDHKSAAVRERAAQALAAIASPASIEPLIDQLDRERGVTRVRIARALEVLCAQPLGTSSEAWRAWWKDHEAGVLAGDIRLGGGKATASQDSGGGDYYGIDMSGEAILFLIDRSHSMKHVMKQGTSGEETKIARAKRELIAALKTLPPRKTFNIVAFAGGTLAFTETMMPASKKNIRSAIEWTRGLTLEFGTALYDGLDHAFTIAGRPLGGAFYESGIDTIFALTDGQPYRPNPDPSKKGLSADKRPAILKAVRAWNALDRVTIHIIGMGEKIPHRFLTRLAGQNGGRYIRAS